MEPTQVPPRRHSPILGAPEGDSEIRSILKKSTTASDNNTAPRLKWDEQNLIITEAQKDSTMKIDEPKTPYIHYNYEEDRVMAPEEIFMLDGPKKKRLALSHTPPVPSYMKGLPDEDEDEDEDEEDDDDDDDRERDPDEWQDSEDEQDIPTGGKPGDHDKFARLRAEHYKMKKDIQLGRQLADEDDEDESEDESESRGAASGSKSRSEKADDEDSLDMEL
ncbi:protein phosphatase inhibitor 2 [Entomortierella parvispora]|uniref:Protein phosphatase inhibitor 2 n=1 Tax=Entomortierella parvispora TaxID=205924 RepID=A0A9P3LSK3_9FUNG|nr:protein phosphatase inhibitor 2 [Entomortierella parvispora]